MKRRALYWEMNARMDLMAIADYINEHNPVAASRVIQKIEGTGRSLQRFPVGHAGRVDGTYERQVVDLPYILSYMIGAITGDEEGIVILRVIHTARDWPEGTWPE